MKRIMVDHEVSMEADPGHKPHYRDSSASVTSFIELMTLNLNTGELATTRHAEKTDLIDSLRVFKKTSPNSLLTLYLASREIASNGSEPAILKGILHVDPKSIQGCRVYAQLTLTFRYGREDEEVMGLRFCNEAIMSLHQMWPRVEDPPRESLTPLQDALIKRLGEGTLPFTLTLTPQAPPSVQLVPAKKYHGAPIGTSYEVRCFIADKSYEKFNRKATVRMSVRVIHRAEITSSVVSENVSMMANKQTLTFPEGSEQCTETSPSRSNNSLGHNATDTLQTNSDDTKKTEERSESHSKIRISPKNFRFCNRFSRSKSETEKAVSNPCLNYSKSFQEYDSCNGPEGEVNKPFLLQEGRVNLHASLDKSWYVHGEDVIVTINIKNESRKTVRKIRVCAIQHVDVCMFNNGKFKNIVADSDENPSTDRVVSPGSSFTSTFILKPQRGTTKNWIALEDCLLRNSDPEEITGLIAASAIKTPGMCTAVGTGGKSERNVFAIYVSYYVKVKLTLSGMGGELSLKLPFVLVHVENTSKNLQSALLHNNSTDSTYKSNVGNASTSKQCASGIDADETLQKDELARKNDSHFTEDDKRTEEDIVNLKDLKIKSLTKAKLTRLGNVEDSDDDDDRVDKMTDKTYSVPSIEIKENNS